MSIRKQLAQAFGSAARGDVVQGFAPREIKALTTGNISTVSWLAFCFPEVAATYQINGAGQEAILPVGSVRVVDATVTSITFTLAASSKCEVM